LALGSVTAKQPTQLTPKSLPCGTVQEEVDGVVRVHQQFGTSENGLTAPHPTRTIFKKNNRKQATRCNSTNTDS